MLTAGPEVQPNSEEKALEKTVISWTAPSGRVVMATCRPHASSLFAPSSVKVVARREPTPVIKYVALTNRSPVPLPCRNAAFKSGSVVILRPRIGVSSITLLLRGSPNCGLSRTPSVVPITSTSAVPPLTANFTVTVAVSLARRTRPKTSFAENPVLVTLILYSPVSDRAANVAEPWSPDIASLLAWVDVFVIVIVAPGTTASFWSTTVTVNAPVLGDCADMATATIATTAVAIDAEMIDRA